jgi:hypothetical protein
LQALPKGGLPFKVSLPQSSTLQVGGKAHFALQNDHLACRPVLLRTASSRQSRVDQLDPNRLAAGAQPSTIDDRAAGELAKMLFAASSGMTRGGQI